MEPHEFLAGKYRDAELMVPGAIQTYRAREASNGRAVFVHRVSMKDQQQSALLAMLRSALLSSAEVRKLIVEFGDDQGYWHVVTQANPDCLLLKPWLEGQAGPSTASEATVVKPREPVPNPVQTPAAPAPPSAPPSAPEPAKKAMDAGPVAEHEPGEFTRLFRTTPSQTPAQTPAPPAQGATPPPEPALSKPQPAEAKQTKPKAAEEAGEFTRLFQSSIKPAEERKADTPPAPPAPPARVDPMAVTESKDESTTAAPGEFTRLFHPAVQSSDVPKEAANEPAKPASTPPPSKPEPGEFTRLFSKDAAVSPRDTAARNNRDRPSRSGFVQRPNTPMPPVRPPSPAPAAENASEPGEFTRLFSGGESKRAGGPPLPQTPSQDPLEQNPLQQNQPPPRSQEPGEFTRLFSSAPPQQPASRAPLTPNRPTTGTPDPFAPSGAGRDMPAMKPPQEDQAGEFTRLFGSTRPVPVQQPASPAPPAAQTPVKPEPLLETRISPPPAAPVAPASPQPKGPSEFTMMMGGNTPAPPSGSAPATAAGGAPAAHSAPSFDPSKLKPMAQQAERMVGSPLHGLHAPPKPHVPALRVPTAVPAGAAAIGKAKNKKLMIFFLILGVLAVALVVLILLILKK